MDPRSSAMDIPNNIDNDGIAEHVNEAFSGDNRHSIVSIGFVNGLLKDTVFANSQRSVG
jgi:hypothetical protein